MTRMERTIQRQWLTIIILIVAIISMFVGFVIYERQFEEQVITQDVSQNADGGDNSYTGNIIGGDFYGEPESQNDS